MDHVVSQITAWTRNMVAPIECLCRCFWKVHFFLFVIGPNSALFCSLSLVLIGCCFPKPIPSPILIETDLHSNFCHIHTAGRDSRCLWVFGNCLFCLHICNRKYDHPTFQQFENSESYHSVIAISKECFKSTEGSCSSSVNCTRVLEMKIVF